ncbi:RNA polymerase sigma factor [Patescibacteria group bacterium]
MNSSFQDRICNDVYIPSLRLYRAFANFLHLAQEFLQGFREQTVVESEEQLAERMINGDDEAFNQLYNLYFDKLYAFIVRRVGHRQIAEDILSNVFMKAFAKRRDFVWKHSFSAWIYRIATNAITDYHRTKKQTVDVDEIPIASDEHKGMVQNVDVDLLRTELEVVLEKIDERSRLAITLKFYGELGNQEMAEVLKCSANNVGVILHRALKKCEKHASSKVKAMLQTQ